MDNESVLVFYKDGVRIIKVNRPNVKNAFNKVVFKILTDTLSNDAVNHDIATTIITSTGSFFSSGLELKPGNEEIGGVIEKFIQAIVNYPKLLIAVVTGPAVGIAVTMLPLFDIVYASNRASFSTPFIHLGVAPGAYSTYFFLRIMGRSTAMEMLLLGKKVSVEEALNFNLVSEIIPHEKINELIEKLTTYGTIPVSTFKSVKTLINFHLNDHLSQVIDKEMKVIRKISQLHGYSQAFEKLKLKNSKL